MKHILLLFLLTVSIEVLAPHTPVLCIVRAEPIYPYERLVEAITWVESGGYPYAYNPDGESVGAFQIRQCKLDDFNKLTNKNYQLVEMYQYKKAKEVFLYFAHKSLDFEYISRTWNGGPNGMQKEQTLKYWKLVKSKL